MGHRSGRSLDEWALTILEQEPVAASPDDSASGDDHSLGTLYQGQVVWASAAACRVQTPDGDLQCRIGAGSRVPDGLVAGDLVLIRDAGTELPQIDRSLPRRTVLSRPDPQTGRKEKVIAANMDAVVIVQAFTNPPIRPGLIDRFLVAIRRGGARPVLCVNKVDLATTEEDLVWLDRTLAPYEAIGVTVARCSATTGRGVGALAQTLAGKLCAFVGHSGVGKSSIVGALHPDLAPATQPVNETIGRGRHTTTASTLYRLPDGTGLLDTPGVREFALWQVGHEELGQSFAEIVEHADRCGFRDCSHTHEPHCAVKAAVESGTISKARFESYRQLRESLE